MDGAEEFAVLVVAGREMVCFGSFQTWVEAYATMEDSAHHANLRDKQL